MNGEGAGATARSTWHTGGKAASIETDPTVEDEVKAVTVDTVARWGRLDVIYDNAGGMAPNDSPSGAE